jgi:hypothetical protein
MSGSATTATQYGVQVAQAEGSVVSGGGGASSTAAAAPMLTAGAGVAVGAVVLGLAVGL